MKLSFYPLLIVIFGLVNCGSGPKIDRKNPPTGGTRSEFIYQVASNMANQGYCAKAMPAFVCLASMGKGWEVAARRAGQCAPLAAEQWQPTDPDAVLKKPLSGRGRKVDIDLNLTFEANPASVRAEGLRQLRRAAQAGWPDAQAELIAQLVEAGDAYLVEAKTWLLRYDANTRRKIYGGDAIKREMRQQLKPINAATDTWTATGFAAEDLNEPQCDSLLGIRRNRPGAHHAPVVEDDGLETIKPSGQHGQAPDGDNQNTPQSGDHH
ncbi:hypothetical protein MNBD_ALPHA06-897 [hydrothermal vent metagenome]|uniref:Uncharacterized protein n=1 Tax=hydrothermal vent metagenome TaxID=652676 RepID=A0A3B0RNG6_9ZZZZ